MIVGVNHTFTISAPNDFAKDWLKSRYSKLILEAIQEVDCSVNTLRIVGDTEGGADDTETVTSIPKEEETTLESLEYRMNRLERQMREILKIRR